MTICCCYESSLRAQGGGEGLLTQRNVLKIFHTIGMQFCKIPAMGMALSLPQFYMAHDS